MSKPRYTARAIVIENDKLLVFERWRTDMLGRELHYFSIPGGGIDDGESPEAAVVREMQEEMTITVKPLRLLARQRAKKHFHYYFLCEITKGLPRFNPESEEAIFRAFHNNRYEVAWLPIQQVAAKVKHDTYRQFLELLPELLVRSDTKTVDMSAQGE